MENMKLFVLGNPLDRCSFVYYGETPPETSNLFSLVSLFKEYKIESATPNKDGSFDIKLKDINFTYKNVLPYKAIQG